MSIEGELIVRVTWDGERVSRVDVRSTRPRLISRLVQGQDSDAAVALIASLHAVCGNAHRAVAATACDAANAREIDRVEVARRERMVDIEAIQEHCTRLGLHWPEAMRTPPLVAFVRDVRTMTSSVLAAMSSIEAHEVERVLHAVAALAGPTLLGMSPRAWLELASLDDLAAWCERTDVAPARWWGQLTSDTPHLGCSPVELMPQVDRGNLESTIARRMHTSERFAHSPDWDGHPVETGALARRRAHPLVADALHRNGNSVATRLIARLTDLAALLDRREDEPPSLFASVIDGHAYAAALTSRGLLVHGVALRDGMVADYAIVAPTEWNFHPRGAFATALESCSAANEQELARDATIISQAIDPCVRCTIEVGHA